MQHLALLSIKAVLRSITIKAAGACTFIFHPLEGKDPASSCCCAAFSLVEPISGQ